MSATKIFAAITGLQPFSLNRVSFTIAFSIAALVIAKLVNAYLFCGFNKNFFVDVPLGVVLFIGYCIMPLLGLAVNRKPTTKGGRCCRTFSIVLIAVWQPLTDFAIFVVHHPIPLLGMDDDAAYDPFNICGSRTVDNVRTQFRNATATFDVFQRIDLIYKIAVGLGWLLLMPFPVAAVGLFMEQISETWRNHPPCERPESGKSVEGNDETIIWMEDSGEGKIEQPSAVAELGSIDIEDEAAPDDAARETGDRKSEVGSVEARMENLGNEINEPGSDAEPQLKEAKEPEFSIVDEEEEATEDSK